MKRIALILLVVVSAAVESIASDNGFLTEKRIYLLDVSGSMKGMGDVKTDDIFDDVVNSLCKALCRIQNPQTEVVIMPFTERTHLYIKGKASDINRLVKEVLKIRIQKGNSNITRVWQHALGIVDSTKVNYIFLLTDGLHNCGKNLDQMAEELKKYKHLTENKRLFTFYAVYSPDAQEKRINRIAEKTEGMWLTDDIDLDVTFIRPKIHLPGNILDTSRVRVDFLTNNLRLFNDRGFRIYVDMENNPYYRIRYRTIASKFTEEMSFDVVPKVKHRKLPSSAQVCLEFACDDLNYPFVYFLPEVPEIEVRKERLPAKSWLIWLVPLTIPTAMVGYMAFEIADSIKLLMEDLRKRKERYKKEKKKRKLKRRLIIAPWIGKHFEEGINGLKIMGLSVGMDFGDIYISKKYNPIGYKTITIRAVQHLFFSIPHPDDYEECLNRFAHTIKEEDMNARNRKVFWNHIGFYNFVQKQCGKGTEVTDEDLYRSEKDFIAVLDTYKPDRVLVLGKKLHRQLELNAFRTNDTLIHETWEYITPTGHTVHFMEMDFTDADFSYEKWKQSVHEFIYN